jgi:hypothetical protein
MKPIPPLLLLPALAGSVPLPLTEPGVPELVPELVSLFGGNPELGGAPQATAVKSQPPKATDATSETPFG